MERSTFFEQATATVAQSAGAVVSQGDRRKRQHSERDESSLEHGMSRFLKDGRLFFAELIKRMFFMISTRR